jgi:hypothetical protein
MSGRIGARASGWSQDDRSCDRCDVIIGRLPLLGYKHLSRPCADHAEPRPAQGPQSPRYRTISHGWHRPLHPAAICRSTERGRRAHLLSHVVDRPRNSGADAEALGPQPEPRLGPSRPRWKEEGSASWMTHSDRRGTRGCERIDIRGSRGNTSTWPKRLLRRPCALTSAHRRRVPLAG